MKKCRVGDIRYRILDACVESTRTWVHVLTIARKTDVKYIYRRGGALIQKKAGLEKPESDPEDPSVLFYFYDEALQTDVVALNALVCVSLGSRCLIYLPLDLENAEHCRFLVRATRDAISHGTELVFQNAAVFYAYDVDTEAYVLHNAHYTKPIHAKPRHYLEVLMDLINLNAQSVKNWDPMASVLCTGYNAKELGYLLRVRGLIEACIVWSLRYRNPAEATVSIARISTISECVQRSSVIQDLVPPDLLPLYDGYAKTKWNL